MYNYFGNKIIEGDLIMKTLLPVLMILVSGCATQQQKANLSNVMAESNGISLISNHPEIINTYIKSPNTQSKYCLEPDPDVVASFGSSVSLGASSGQSNDTLSASQSGSAVTTGGLSPMVLVIREFMYRACEMSMNTNATKEETIAIYQNFLKTIETIASDFSQEAGTAPSQPAAQ